MTQYWPFVIALAVFLACLFIVKVLGEVFEADGKIIRVVHAFIIIAFVFWCLYHLPALLH